MFLLRLILLVLAAFFVRGLVRRAFASSRRRARRDPLRGPGDGARRPYRDLTDQEISDADFEEIP